jgi:antitoxin VapB
MGLNIKNPEVESAIRALAAKTGESLTDAVDHAVREKLARLQAEEPRIQPARTVEEFLERIKPIQEEIAEAKRARGITQSLRELMDDLYDEHGLPK